MIEDESISFLFDCYGWTMRAFGQQAAADAEMILPTPEFFPLEGIRPTKMARAVFECARRHAGLADWPLTLRREAPTSMLGIMANTVHSGVEGAVSSGMLVEGTPAEPVFVVTYVDDDLLSLDGFLAHLAYQFGCVLAAHGEEQPPGGEENVGYLADVCGVFLGFGIMAANAAFIFQQTQDFMTQGHWFQRRGWLSQDEFAYALAIWSHLGAFDRKAITKALSRGPRSTYKRAMKDIAKRRMLQLAQLRGIAPSSVGGLSFVPRDGALSKEPRS